jgi:hypothetical protein
VQADQEQLPKVRKENAVDRQRFKMHRARKAENTQLAGLSPRHSCRRDGFNAIRDGCPQNLAGWPWRPARWPRTGP